MTKEKMILLQAHLQKNLNRLSSPVPTKHINRPKEFKQFLENEIASTRAKLEAATLTAAPVEGAKK